MYNCASNKPPYYTGHIAPTCRHTLTDRLQSCDITHCMDVCRMSETAFLEFSDVDNHDDYYSVDEEGQVHVRDERGCYVMYDAAIDDMR